VRLLVIDASLNRRIAAELKGRGRAAASAAELGAARMTDAELIRALSRRLADEPWVLVTADDFLPGEHGELLTRHHLTVATVAALGRGVGVGEERHARETCHRWAHAMAAQEPGSVRRYSPAANRAWTPLMPRPDRPITRM
jgi:hypothetical protein